MRSAETLLTPGKAGVGIVSGISTRPFLCIRNKNHSHCPWKAMRPVYKGGLFVF